MPLVSQLTLKVDTGESASPSQVATQARSPPTPEPSEEGEPADVARQLDTTSGEFDPGSVPSTPRTPNTIELVQNGEVLKLVAEGGGLLGEEPTPAAGSGSPRQASTSAVPSPGGPAPEVHQPGAGVVKITNRTMGSLPDSAALEKRTFEYSQYCLPEMELDVPRGEMHLDLDAVCFHGFLTKTIHPASFLCPISQSRGQSRVVDEDRLAIVKKELPDVWDVAGPPSLEKS